MSVKKLSEIRVPSKQTWHCTEEKMAMRVKYVVSHTSGGVVAKKIGQYHNEHKIFHEIR